MNHNQEFKQGLFVGLVVGAGAAYLLYSNRKQIQHKMWKLKAKADLHRRLSNLKHVSKKEYEELVDVITDKYRRVSNVTGDEIDDFADELKGRWESVKARFSDAVEEITD